MAMVGAAQAPEGIPARREMGMHGCFYWRSCLSNRWPRPLRAREVGMRGNIDINQPFKSHKKE
jgi:hypothetical protein